MPTTAPHFDLVKIQTLRELRNKARALNKAVSVLAEPALHDFAMLPHIYQVYLNFFTRRGCPKEATKVFHRKKFLLVALYLYSPRTLAGDRIVPWLRMELTKLFGLTSGSSVSDNCANLLFYYQHYRDFRQDTDAIYRDVLDFLNAIQVQRDNITPPAE